MVYHLVTAGTNFLAFPAIVYAILIPYQFYTSLCIFPLTCFLASYFVNSLANIL